MHSQNDRTYTPPKMPNQCVIATKLEHGGLQISDIHIFTHEQLVAVVGDQVGVAAVAVPVDLLVFVVGVGDQPVVAVVVAVSVAVAGDQHAAAAAVAAAVVAAVAAAVAFQPASVVPAAACAVQPASVVQPESPVASGAQPV